MAVLSPMEIITDRNSILDAEGEMPQAMSLMPLFKGCVVWTIPMNKFNYSLPHRYSAIIASQYDQAATCPSYQLMKIKGINVFEVLRENPRAVEVSTSSN